MTASPADRLMTAEELLEMPDDGYLYGLVAGRLIRMSPLAWSAAVVASNMNVEVGLFVRRHQLGIRGTADGGVLPRRAPDTVRAPDVWFVRAERVPTDVKNECFPGSPDRALELLSPGDRFSDVVQKARDYFAAGSLIVWVLDPQGRTTAMFRPDGSARLLAEDDPIEGEDVLPGFSVTPRQLLP